MWSGIVLTKKTVTKDRQIDGQILICSKKAERDDWRAVVLTDVSLCCKFRMMLGRLSLLSLFYKFTAETNVCRLFHTESLIVNVWNTYFQIENSLTEWVCYILPAFFRLELIEEWLVIVRVFRPPLFSNVFHPIDISLKRSKESRYTCACTPTTTYTNNCSFTKKVWRCHWVH